MKTMMYRFDYDSEADEVSETVDIDHMNDLGGITVNGPGLNHPLDIRAAIEWCKEHQSKNLFHYYWLSTRWWFENEDDALLFALKWGA